MNATNVPAMILNLALLALFIGGVYWVMQRLRPRVRERRLRAWREAGLLPEQVDENLAGEEPVHEQRDVDGHPER